MVWQSSDGDSVSKIHTREEIERATREVEEKGHRLPIKDGLEVGSYKPEEFDIPAEVTSDEESELPGTARPRKACAHPGDGLLAGGGFRMVTW